MSRKTVRVTHLDILRHLNRSNCGQCGVPTCLAFSNLLLKGEKQLSDCPHIGKDEAEYLAGELINAGQETEKETLIEPLMREASAVDFSKVAEGIGARLQGGRLRITCLGKEFAVDRKGSVESAIHINKWVIVPLLKYIITGGSVPLSGRWVSFEELKKASAVTRYFEKRCEEPLRQLAESHTDIFFDLITIFGGKDMKGFSADFARVINPLPKVPFLILYWRPEDHFGSKLKVLLDSTADRYLDVEYIIALGRGIVEMFKKILSHHEEVLPTLMSL